MPDTVSNLSPSLCYGPFEWNKTIHFALRLATHPLKACLDHKGFKQRFSKENKHDYHKNNTSIQKR